MNIAKARKILRKDEKDFVSVEDALRECEAIWTYHGYDGEPHVLLTSALHSDGYCDVNQAMIFPQYRTAIVKYVVNALLRANITKDNVDFIVSSSEAGRIFGQELGSQMGVASVFTEKIIKEQVWTNRFEIPDGAIVFQAEELITTMGTTMAVKAAVIKNNPHPFSFLMRNGKQLVVTVVHRPAQIPKTYDDYTVIAAMEKAMHAWRPDQCPICREHPDSEALGSFKTNRAKFMEFELRFALENT